MLSLQDPRLVREATPRGSQDGLYILPVSLLDTHAMLVAEFRSISDRLRVPIGWHYLLDLVWAADQLETVDTRPRSVLDAGAGVGLMQWLLASHGVEVTSVDRSPRQISRRMRKWTTVIGDPIALPSVRRSALDRLGDRDGVAGGTWIRRVPGAVRDLVLGDPASAPRGRVLIAQADLRELDLVESESVDAVVSISSLEHNSLEDLPAIVAELLRVLRPGGKLVATLGASSDRDWFHEPSQGWCLTEKTLKALFNLPDDCRSNFGEYDHLMHELEGCAELRDNLADFYFRSGNNGMPWGRWDPKYQSVGVVKVKPA